MLVRALLGWIFICGGLMAVFGSHPGGGVICVAVGVALHAFNIQSAKRRRASLAAIHSAMLNAAGVAPNSGCDHAEQDSGIAVNIRARTLTLLSKGKWKTYPFSDIRQWATNKSTAGEQIVVGGGALGFAAMAGAASANAAAAERAEMASGFFVTVRDIENPKWRVAMRSLATQDRWMEILTQAINEDAHREFSSSAQRSR
ncbi:DUF4755 domain-containing protein [Rugamonas sp.]|uniref:DUF4755 domain-containing protein n=1 Tax=Rugamonas sp. TaxID=1926287 RepID=UPI0025EE89BA|nr:DUF4755 domain-containing protein [Rugamonas sp.]